MSLARTSSLLLSQHAKRAVVTRTYASSHGEHHGTDHTHASETQVAFPKEDFSSPVWRNFVLASLLAVGFYKFAPSRDEDNYLTRFIQHYAPSRELWARLNEEHLLLSAEGQTETLIVADAKKPPVHRYRYPESFEQHSPHLQPVGMSVDLSNLVVKGEKA